MSSHTPPKPRHPDTPSPTLAGKGPAEAMQLGMIQAGLSTA